MLQDYLGFVVMFAVAALLGLALPILHQLLGPRRPNYKKLMPYESGMDPIGSARDRFSVKFYLIAMLFIIFDIEVIFMYPWAVNFKSLGWLGFVEMLLFMGFLLVGFFYIIKRGALKWE
ncbi:MAG: NADH-quinone oxidoreductase subunit A [bacterium]